MLIQHVPQPGCGGLLGADDNEARRRPFRRCQRTSPVTLIFFSLRPISCTHRMHHLVWYCLTQNRCIHSGSLSPPGKNGIHLHVVYTYFAIARFSALPLWYILRIHQYWVIENCAKYARPDAEAAIKSDRLQPFGLNRYLTRSTFSWIQGS